MSDDTARRAANTILARLGDIRRADKRWDPMPYPELEQLAREYLWYTGARGHDEILGNAPYHITIEAARQHGAVERLDDDMARRVLAVRLYHAHRSGDGSWRTRRDPRIDLSARVQEQDTVAGALRVVVESSTRPMNRGGGGRR